MGPNSDIPPEVADARDTLIATLGDDLAALIWQGSWARGEPTAESDYDMIVILRRAGEDTLRRLQAVFDNRPGWSAYVKTEAELRQYSIAGRTQFHYGCRTIYGEFEPPPLSREAILEEIRSHIATINHECRYRIMHDAAKSYRGLEPEFVKERNVRWMYYMAKAAILAMKARAYLVHGSYPVTRKELRGRITDPLELEIIDAVDHWSRVKAQYAEDITAIALKLDAFAGRLADWLDNVPASFFRLPPSSA